MQIILQLKSVNKLKVIFALKKCCADNKFLEYSGAHAIGYFHCVGFEFLRSEQVQLRDRIYNPRQKSLKHPFPLCKVEMTFQCFTGYNNIAKGRGTEVVRECSKCFKVFV